MSFTGAYPVSGSVLAISLLPVSLARRQDCTSDEPCSHRRSVFRRGARESRRCFSLPPCFAQGRRCAVIEVCPAGREFADSFSATPGCSHAGSFLWLSLQEKHRFCRPSLGAGVARFLARF